MGKWINPEIKHIRGHKRLEAGNEGSRFSRTTTPNIKPEVWNGLDQSLIFSENVETNLIQNMWQVMKVSTTENELFHKEWTNISVTICVKFVQ